jgi:phage shock protein PspC (stress-responsive transcriptional regulator)
MQTVTTVNLNGRAYQLETDAYAALQAYLKAAEKALARNPDKTEILSDLEQAVADKCEAKLIHSKTVVSAEQMHEILEAVGPVSDALPEDSEAAPEDYQTPKRLLRLQSGAPLAGLCAGLGAYFGIDANLIRAGFVILTIITGGLWIVVYIILAIFVPAAKNSADVAEAYGNPLTAMEIVARAKGVSLPQTNAVRSIAEIANRLWALAVRLVYIAASALVVVVGAAWLCGLALLLTGQLHLSAQLQPFNGLPEALSITTLFLLIAIPLALISRGCRRMSGIGRMSNWSADITLAAIWILAAITAVTLVSVYGRDFQQYATHHAGYINYGSHQLCTDQNRCGSGPMFPVPDGKFLPFQQPSVPPPPSGVGK